MAVIRVHKNANYTVMSNYHFKEKKMSLKAKGLLSLMLSLPDDWDYSINGLATLSKDGRDSVMSALKELEQFGYLERTRITNDLGQFKGYDYDIYELPQEIKSDTEKPNSEKPNTEKPIQLNTNQINSVGINNLNNKDKKDKQDKRAEAPEIRNEELDLPKANAFTKQLIKANYIEEDDLFISLYNQLFVDLIEEYSFERIRACLYYFTKRLNNGKAIDENGNEVENKYGYLKISLTNNAEGLQRKEDVDPFSEESIKETLALFGK